MKSTHARIAIISLVSVVAMVLVLCTATLALLYMTLGHRVGNQERRGKVRELLHRLYGAQEVSFQSSHGVMLAGLLIKKKQARGTVILCHGYRHSKELMARYIRLFSGYNLLLFDFRGAGQSGGFFSSIGYYEADDVKAAIRFVRNTLPPDQCRPLILFGVSMGAAAVLKAASETSVGIDGLILDSPYSSLQNIIDQAAHHFVMLPRAFIALLSSFMQWILGPILSMHPATYVARLAVPVLFIHAASDSVTNAAHSVCLFRAVHRHRRAKAWLWLTPPAKHAFSYISYPIEYQKRVDQFLGRLMPR